MDSFKFIFPLIPNCPLYIKDFEFDSVILEPGFPVMITASVISGNLTIKFFRSNVEVKSSEASE